MFNHVCRKVQVQKDADHPAAMFLVSLHAY
jgi:hypothetical protein